VRRTTIIGAWNSMILVVALLPLAIFWVGRGEAFRPGAGEEDDTWPWHLLASGIYLLAVAATVAWVRWGGRKGIAAAIVAVAASVWASMWFAEIGTAHAFEAGIAGLPVTVAVWILVYLAAANAAWILVWSALLIVRRGGFRYDRSRRGVDPEDSPSPDAPRVP
jgi:hypothetical protein